MNNNLQVNPVSVKVAMLLTTCLYLILHYYK